MIKWLSIVVFSVWFIAGCATQNSPPASTTPVDISTNSISGTGDQLAKLTGYSDYDNIVITRIKNTWDGLLKNTKMMECDGQVVVDFILHSDGTVSDIKVSKDNISFWSWLPARGYCVRAIKKSAPFPKWPQEMVDKLGNQREAKFIFVYEDAGD